MDKNKLFEILKNNKITDEQVDVILDETSNNRTVIACAGSGKSTTIVNKIIYLMKEKKVSADEIVVITYTNDAAKDLKIKIYNKVKKIIGSIQGLNSMFIGTIHSYAMDLICNVMPQYKSFLLIEDNEAINVIKKNSEELNIYNSISWDLDWSEDIFHVAYRIINEYTELDEESFNNLNISVFPNFPEFNKSMFKKLAEDFFLFLTKQQKWTFTMFLKILNDNLTNENFVKYIKNKLKYLFVDEFQDVNYIQGEIVNKIHNLGVNLLVVGDEDQAIYQFRGSNSKYIVDRTREQNGEFSFLGLSKNFRGTNQIVSVAKNYIELNNEFNNRVTTKNFTWNTTSNTKDIYYSILDDKNDEVENIVSQIKAFIKKGYRYKDIVILYRSRNEIVKNIIFRLEEEKIPSTNFGSLLENPLIEKIWNIICFINRPNCDEKLVKLKINDLIKMIHGNKDQVNDITDGVFSFYLQTKRWLENFNYIVKQRFYLQKFYMEFLNKLRLDRLNQNDKYVEIMLYNLGEFSKYIDSWERVPSNYKLPKNTKLNKFIEDTIEKSNEIVGTKGNEYVELDAVTIDTIHSSKGLEWKIVFLCCLTNKLFQKSYVELQKKKESNDVFLLSEEKLENYRKVQLEEQRNLIYVAMTRSKKYLLLSASKNEKDTIEPLNEILNSNSNNNFLNNTETTPLEIEENNDNASDTIPISLSYTSLTVYDECPSKFKFKFCYNFCDGIDDYSGRGEAIHLVFECYMKKTDPGYEIGQYVDKYFILPYVSKSKLPSIKAHITNDFKDVLSKDVFNDNVDHEVEYEIEIPLEVENVDVLISGKIDLIANNEIIDYKTSGVDANESLNTDQLVIYYKGFKETTQKSLNDGYILDFENNKLIGPRKLNEDEWKKIEQKILLATKEIKNDRFSCNINRCQKCPYSKICHKIPK